MPPTRHQTQTERDLEGIEAKVRREHEQAERLEHELALPHEVTEPVTGILTGMALAAAREEREPIERIRHLEERLDEEREEKIALGQRLASVEKIRDDLFARLVEMAERGFDAKLELGTAKGKDKIDAGKSRRELVGKVVLYILGLLAAGGIGSHLK